MLVWGGSLSQPVIGYMMDLKPRLCFVVLLLKTVRTKCHLQLLNASARGKSREGQVRWQAEAYAWRGPP